MQFDHEGKTDACTISKKLEQHPSDNEERINLSKHFLDHGLSQSAYQKIAPEIENGDMNATILIDCDDNDLILMANEYNFTFLQKKAFINAVNLLKPNINNRKHDPDKNSNEPHFVPVYVSAEEQSILNDITKLGQMLIQHSKRSCETKANNLNQMTAAVEALKNYKKLLIQLLSEEINKLIKKCEVEIESDEKQLDLIQNEINNQLKTLTTMEKDFKKSLNRKQKNTSDKRKDNHNYNRDIKNSVDKSKQRIITFTNKNKIQKIDMVDNIKINMLVSKFSHHFKENFSIKRARDQIKAQSNFNYGYSYIKNTITRASISKDSKLENSKHVQINEKNIVSARKNAYGSIFCKFNYLYDDNNKGSKRHSIENNGLKLVCNHRAWSLTGCFCFFCSYSYKMKPKSGQYRMKIQIDNIDNSHYGNIIGVISQKSVSQNDEIKNNYNNTFYWYYQLYDYIGWSACDTKDDKYLPNGLLCGYNELSISKNIYRKNHFVYKSNNDNYKKRLPIIKSNDVILLSYDSDNGILSFSKEENDDQVGELNAQISNLPIANTYYWFVGHEWGKMSLTVV